MVDVRAKGAAGETQARDLLRKHTGLKFERMPSSGALEYLKGDLWVPRKENYFCIEVKFYKESHFNDKILTAPSNNWIGWWKKIRIQAFDMEQDPLLLFKYNRSKIFVTTEIKPMITHYMYSSEYEAYTCIADDWLKQEDIDFIK